PQDRGPVLRGSGERRTAPAHVPGRGPGPGGRTSSPVPRAVLGWPPYLLGTAGTPTVADAARSVQDRSCGTRRVAALHAHRGRRGEPGPRAPQTALGLPGDGGTKHVEFVVLTDYPSERTDSLA